jgi:transposase
VLLLTVAGAMEPSLAMHSRDEGGYLDARKVTPIAEFQLIRAHFRRGPNLIFADKKQRQIGNPDSEHSPVPQAMRNRPRSRKTLLDMHGCSSLLGPSADCLIALEATGHYWRNLFVALIAKDYAVAVLNPLRTARFAEEELRRTKTDAIDALGIARFAQQKRPRAAKLPDSVTEELRELERLRQRVAEDFAHRLRQLHRAVDLGFPEFTRYVRTLESQLAATILSRYPTAASFRGVSGKKRARIVYEGSHKIGDELARNLIEAAEKSVGAHHSEPYRRRIKYLCEDLDVLRRRLNDLARDVERKLYDHEVGKLLMSIEGVGPLTAACLIAELGDPARFDSPGAIASYVGVIPRIRQSGKKRFTKGSAIPLGNARLRKSLFVVVLQLVRRNPWLRQYYERLRAAGKPGKVAIIAAM